jgi:hypothetical protein
VQKTIVATRRRRSLPSAASGSAQIAYHGKSHAVEHSSASVVHPAAERQSAPLAVRQSAITKVSTNSAMKMSRHQAGVPSRPRSRAVSAGMLCVATSCCWPPTAPMNPSAPDPKPSSETAAMASR